MEAAVGASPQDASAAVRRGEAGLIGRGLAGTTAAICAAVMVAVTALAASLPSGEGFLNGAVSSDALNSFVHWCLIFGGVLLVDALFSAVGTEPARRLVGAATFACAATVLGKAVVAFGPALGGSSAAAIAFVPAALLAGSALAGMLVGHWYLVAPSLTFRALRLAIYTVLAAIALQAAAVVVVTVTAPAATRDA